MSIVLWLISQLWNVCNVQVWLALVSLMYMCVYTCTYSHVNVCMVHVVYTYMYMYSVVVATYNMYIQLYMVCLLCVDRHA